MQPLTPVQVQDKPALALPQSTPQTRGTASHVSYDEYHTQADYMPYLAEDLKAKKVVTLDTFTNYVFPKGSPNECKNIIRGIVSSEDIQTLLKKYDEAGSSESAMYDAFAELANKASDLLVKGADIKRTHDLIFCRNDPSGVIGSYAYRKPDVVYVKSLPGVDLLSNNDRSDTPFAWHELFMFIKFKRERSTTENTQEGQTQQSSMYPARFMSLFLIGGRRNR